MPTAAFAVPRASNGRERAPAFESAYAKWINGANKGKVDLKSVEVGGKRVLVAIPAEPKRRKRTETRYRFRTVFASLFDLQASQYKDAFDLFLPLVQASTGELSQLVTSMERRKPGSGLRHLDESLKAQSL